MSCYRVLMVEDDENDLLLTKRAFKKHFSEASIYVVRDGEEAIEYLTGKGYFADATRFPLPGIVITDLKTPKLSGFELLEWMKAHHQFHAIPTIVLTSSKHDKDVTRAYELGASSYFLKPNDFKMLEEIVKQIKTFCEENVKLESNTCPQP